MNKITPIRVSSEDKFFDLAANNDIDIDQLIYFALSIFWRAGAHSWKLPNSNELYKIQLGPYLEELRLFLLGQSSFPSNASLAIYVSPTPQYEGIIYPKKPNRNGDHFTRHVFFIPGITFALCLGKKIPEDIRNECVVRNKIIVLTMAGEYHAQNLYSRLASV